MTKDRGVKMNVLRNRGLGVENVLFFVMEKHVPIKKKLPNQLQRPVPKEKGVSKCLTFINYPQSIHDRNIVLHGARK